MLTLTVRPEKPGSEQRYIANIYKRKLQERWQEHGGRSDSFIKKWNVNRYWFGTWFEKQKNKNEFIGHCYCFIHINDCFRWVKITGSWSANKIEQLISFFKGSTCSVEETRCILPHFLEETNETQSSCERVGFSEHSQDLLCPSSVEGRVAYGICGQGCFENDRGERNQGYLNVWTKWFLRCCLQTIFNTFFQKLCLNLKKMIQCCCSVKLFLVLVCFPSCGRVKNTPLVWKLKMEKKSFTGVQQK